MATSYSISIFEGSVDDDGVFEIWQCVPGQSQVIETGTVSGGRFAVDAAPTISRTVVVRGAQIVRLPPMQYVDFNVTEDDRTFLLARREVAVDEIPIGLQALEDAVAGLDLDSLDTTIASNVVFISGVGRFQGIGMSFDATILLTPEHAPCFVGAAGFPNRVIQAQVSNIDIRSTAGGVDGWLLTALLDVAIGLLGPAIRNLLTTQIQQRVDVAVGNMFDDEGLPPGSVVTVQTIGGGGPGTLVLDAVAAVLLERACASTFSARAAFRPAVEISFLRMLRSNYLSHTTEGRTMGVLFDRFRPELRRLLANDRDACAQLDVVVDSLREDFDAPKREGRLSKRTASELTKLVKGVRKTASKELQTIFDGALSRLPDFVGKHPDKVLATPQKARRKSS